MPAEDAPGKPVGWDTKTQSTTTQIHHQGKVYHEHAPFGGGITPKPVLKTPGVDMRSDTIEHT